MLYVGLPGVRVVGDPASVAGTAVRTAAATSRAEHMAVMNLGIGLPRNDVSGSIACVVQSCR